MSPAIRALIAIPVILATTIGFLIGLIVGPFVFGILAGYELVEDFIEQTRKNRALHEALDK